MPTENRSSNTEMVSDLLPCPFCGEKPQITKHHREDIYSFMHRCPVLGPISWGFREDPQAHVEKWNARAQPISQPHPEPIAWMVGTAIWWTKEEAERDAAATGLPVAPVGPLTGSAEVEQLREVIKHSDAQIMRQSMRISNQRAQLAERDTLLRDKSGDLIRMAAHLISAPLFALQDLQDEDKKMTRARVDHAVDVADARLKDAAYELRRIADALSACVEPSVPVTAEEKA